jgi:hypothetical protein
VKAGGRQRTDSTHVLGRIRDLNRLELAGEAGRWRAGVRQQAGPRIGGDRSGALRHRWLCSRLRSHVGARSRILEYAFSASDETRRPRRRSGGTPQLRFADLRGPGWRDGVLPESAGGPTRAAGAGQLADRRQPLCVIPVGPRC